ncbi:hypothetical protein Leryth_009347 [Lithospermum erythrorhizon]|nr:hypothetical protein Leryth_009347 [Lithospermum erythrorhizon]
MAQPLQLRRVTLLLRRTHHRPTTLPPPRFLPLFTKQPFSTTSTPYPLQYELIISRPIHPPPPHRRPLKSHPQHSNQPQEPNIPFKDFVDARLNKLNNLEINQENGENEGFIDIDKRGRRRMMGSDIEDFKQPQENNIPFEDLVDERLNNVEIIQENGENEGFIELDKRKRKYYNKRRRRMIGSDTEDEEYRGRGDDEFVELKQEVVELKTLHKREEELYFYDAFAYPWEKDKHYKMVYQLEKKYFPDQGFDKAFLDPGKRNADERKSKRAAKNGEKGIVENKMVFFEDKEKEGGGGDGEEAKVDVSEKKVGEFFKSLKKVPGEDAQPEPFLSTRRTGLPPQWDTPTGTVLLVNKPKGWTSFTVCGKLRRLVKVKKVGHAGTLDPMATGLLIVCVGKSTKIVDRYQGMTKGYSGIFRLGEATSTWDADSPVGFLALVNSFSSK